MSSKGISRRELLPMIAAGSLALSLAGHIGYERYIKEYTVPLYSQDQFSIDESLISPLEGTSYDTNSDPLFRAGNVSITAGLGIYGHASLIENDNDLVLSTAEHVAIVAQTEDISIIQIPGVGMIPVNPERFIFGRKDGKEEETSAFYVFGPNNQVILRNAVANNEIKPLKLINKRPQLYEMVAIPRGEHGDYAFYRYVDYHSSENLFELDNSPDICKGDSGAPILELGMNSMPSGNSYGTLLGARKPTWNAESNNCSSIILARPND